jgi:hypothetical protein
MKSNNPSREETRTQRAHRARGRLARRAPADACSLCLSRPLSPPSANLNISRDTTLDPSLKRTKAVRCAKCGNDEACFFARSDEKMRHLLLRTNCGCRHVCTTAANGFASAAADLQPHPPCCNRTPTSSCMAEACNRKTHLTHPFSPFLPVVLFYLCPIYPCQPVRASLCCFRFLSACALASLCLFARRALFVCLVERDSTPTTVDLYAA